jgi:hypothetical protein
MRQHITTSKIRRLKNSAWENRSNDNISPYDLFAVLSNRQQKLPTCHSEVVGIDNIIEKYLHKGYSNCP